MIGRTPEQFIDNIVSLVQSHGASDVHLSVGRQPILRVDGILQTVPDVPPLGIQDVSDAAGLILTKERLDDFLENKKEVDVSFVRGEETRFRVNAYTSMGNPTLAMRVIPKRIRTIEELDLPASLERFTSSSQGFVLITGPTGHGKTTTMAALVDIINHTRIAHITTIEDPIEYVFQEDKCLIHQREVGSDTSSFAQALRVVPREDPNVVVIGEMRDLESISAALTIAETGHLVFATLHTNNAAQTINRIVDVFPPMQQQQIRSQLAATLTGVVSQRLLPRQDGGRVPAVEIMFATHAVRSLIREGETHQIPNVIETGSNDGMVPLRRSLIELLQQGSVSRDAVLPHLDNPDALIGHM